jgi:hypothetical protein
MTLGLVLGAGFLLAVAGAEHAAAAPINPIAPASLTGTLTIDFESVAGGATPGTNYDAGLSFFGASFAERFAGQTLSFSGDFDILTGPATGPLTLVNGAAGRNIGVVSGFPTNVVHGLGNLGFPNFNAIGEGALSVLYDADQSQVGFDVGGANAGQGTVEFYARDGSIIDTIVIASLANQTYAFERDGGLADIAGISLTNFNGGGVNFDNFVMNPIPEPSAVTLFGIGSLIVGAYISRRSKQL